MADDPSLGSFDSLTPDRFLPVLEQQAGLSLASIARSLPSYINRVYEIAGREGTGYVVKFYRPDRWSSSAIEEEHRFVRDCDEAEIPTVAPLVMLNGSTVGYCDRIPFALYPKKGGRSFDIESDNAWKRVGGLLARIHAVGAQGKAPSRLSCTPQVTAGFVDRLCRESVPQSMAERYRSVCMRILDEIQPLFADQPQQRIHGDFHCGNVLCRPDEGLVVIDFDDMMNGTPAQDIWLLMPERYPACRDICSLLFEGYALFAQPQQRWMQLIEPLRAMRMIYFTAWCAQQRHDYAFTARFADWGSDSFWSREIRDLTEQYGCIGDALSA